MTTFDIDKLHANADKRKKFDDLFASIDESIVKLLKAKKFSKQAFNDVLNISNILKIKDMDQKQEEECQSD